MFSRPPKQTQTFVDSMGFYTFWMQVSEIAASVAYAGNIQDYPGRYRTHR
jgi:hypothetical protein